MRRKGCYTLRIGNFSFFLKRFYLFIFRKKERKGEREGEKYHCVVAFSGPPTGDLACNPGMYPDWEPNWLPFDSQAHAQSTELHWPGTLSYIFKSQNIYVHCQCIILKDYMKVFFLILVTNFRFSVQASSKWQA